jgi:DsbC/DsbD-like thiol-disulfide interchange protein
MSFPHSMSFDHSTANSIRAVPLACLAVLLASTPVVAGEPSPWSDAHGGAVRLVPGAMAATGAKSTIGVWRAGLEIRLLHGWKTYWRNPGDSGVPPVFDWSKSDNVARLTVSWPAPARFDDETGTSIGYKGDVMLPLRVEAKDAARPVTLSLALDYAVCEAICVPAKGEARLVLDPASSGSDALDQRILAEQDKVPVETTLLAPGAVGIDKVALDRASSPPRLLVEARAKVGAQLFVEGPDNWYLPVPGPQAGQPGAGLVGFVLPLEGTPKDAVLSGTPLRFTLVSPDGAVEIPYVLP